jgi:tRNA (guanine37-N1)-methyltransferase
MKIKIVTLFPEMFQGFLSESIIKRAIDKGNVEFEIIDFRKYSHDKHHHVDDTPYGGGAGMVLRCDILDECIEDIKTPKSHIALMSPQGVQYDQAMANRLAKEEELILVCGHYEGFDERVRGYVDEEISMGDFVLTGGEIPAMAISDSVTRLLDGAIREESYEDDSFYNGLLEYPQYTRPQVYKGVEVPFVLQNGDHAKIKTWRLKESLRKTYLRRPDLLKNRTLTKEEAKLLAEVKDELNNN